MTLAPNTGPGCLDRSHTWGGAADPRAAGAYLGRRRMA
jgi:hypothetical protein